ncbi:hypothetical protein BpHYR1_018009 [Brachionus plicatilis]|uniref:Endonuclease/exonuclease/phosphatase domain-containing protein n=1 Tax=Brachionus plicatilis TaxID=10195 RepID=A0A3M7PGD1_BRAPC|nr:hypothetical protein BpHYR1_018009 [Brachionus plicatilis]
MTKILNWKSIAWFVGTERHGCKGTKLIERNVMEYLRNDNECFSIAQSQTEDCFPNWKFFSQTPFSFSFKIHNLKFEWDNNNQTTGNLNARTKQIGCLGENENGSLNYNEILDLFLVSSSLIDKETDFSVLNSQYMTSDHFQIEASISIDYLIKSN